MKWLGKIADPKDLTTKEYVDDADKALKSSTSEALSALDKSKVNSSDITEYSKDEVKSLWDRAFIKV